MSVFRETVPIRRRYRWLSVAAGLVLAAGVAAVLVVFLGNTGTKLDTPIRNEAPQVPSKAKNTPLAPSARLVAGRFIDSAVARKNLAASWPLVGPELKAGMTKKEWLTGNIPVIPFTAKIGQVRLKVDSSQPNHALLEALILPKAGNVKPAFFFLELRKTKGHWLVISWTPRANIGVPSTLNN